jgi:hypothetical protein
VNERNKHRAFDSGPRLGALERGCRRRPHRPILAAFLLGATSIATPALTHAQGLAARVAVVDAPRALGVGVTASAVVEVTNAGDDTWPAGGPIRLAYHLRDASGRMLTFDGERTVLPHDAAPGRTVRLCARLTAPHTDGPVVVEWDLVHEGVAWLSEVHPRATASHDLTVFAPGAPPAAGARGLAIAWLFITVAHAASCVAWGVRRRRARPSMTIDEAAFTTLAVWLGSLSAALHLAAATVGLSLIGVGAGLLAAHVLLRRLAMADPHGSPDDAVAPDAGGWLDLAGLAVLLVIVAGWIAGDVRSAAIGGTDAAHYHVPHAVNLALGGRLFDPPATGHLYPMGTSVLAAWLIVPTGTGLLVDSATLPWFLLLASALGWLFRQMTGVSGLSVVPWFMLGLLTLPIVRISAPMSADLPYAAAFVALLAHGVAVARTARSTDAVLLGALLTGLLLGTKTTGVPAAALLLGLIVGGLAARRPTTRDRPASPRRILVATAMAAGIAVAAGGIWQVRNWWNYGSPIAPMGVRVLGTSIVPGQPYDEMRLHLSVLRDLRDHGATRTWRTARRHLRAWAGPWLTIVGWLLPLVLVDALLARRRGAAPDLARTRLIFLALATVSSAVLTFLLAGAPWTSLVWTNGLSLRYVLPAIVLGAFLLPLAAFPAVLPWYRAPRARAAGTLIVAAAAIAAVVMVDPPPEQDFGRHLLAVTPWSTASGLALAALLAALVRWRPPPRAAIAAAVVATIAIAGAAGSGLAARAADRVRAAAAGRGMPAPCPGGQPERAPERAVAALVDRHARFRAQPHARRRVFVAARFDMPLALQGPAFDTLVYDARDPELVEARLSGGGPGAGPADYVVASIAELETERGTPIVRRLGARARLVPLGDAGPFRVWHIAP